MSTLNTRELAPTQIGPRSSIPNESKWDVEALYENPNLWKKEFTSLKQNEKAPFWPDLAQFRGKLSDPKMVAALLDRYFVLERGLVKLYTYAHLRFDEDLEHGENKTHFGMVSNLLHDFQLEVSWIEPELLALSEPDFASLLKDPQLKEYHFYLEKMGRMRPHTLSIELEELLALSSKALDTSSKAFSALSNADLQFAPAKDSQGKEHPVSQGAYLALIKSPDRTLRKNAFESLHRAYMSHANTFCELLQGELQGHAYKAKARKFKNSLEAALFPHQISPKVYDNLITSIRKHLPLMHEYMSLRKKVLSLDTLYPYDLHVPIAKESRAEFRYEEARSLVLESVAPLGKKYQDALKQGLFEDRWVDIYENEKKRSGAYSSGCYDSRPYILMNFSQRLNDVFTLAHEAGHSMHSYLSRKTQSYVYSGYPIFVAEVASTFNEQLLLNLLKEKAQSKEELAYLINYEIEQIRNTIFRQTLFAEFEKKVHELVESGMPLTPEALKEIYGKLNADYYGTDLTLTPELEMEWARIPHFYYNFYVYQYATGLSAALTLFEKASQNSEAIERYLQFLSSGGTLYPIDLLKRAGVDMEKPEAVDLAMEHFSKLVQELKTVL